MTRTPEQRRQHATRTARRRVYKMRRKECRDCIEPVALDAAGRPMRLCRRHADADAERKRHHDAGA